VNPLPVLREGLHVSVSQLKCYLKCPRQYELRYVRGVRPAFVPVPLAFGSAFHAALAAYYVSHKAGHVASVERLVGVFEEEWARQATGPVPLECDKDDGDFDHLAKAAVMLAAFHRHAAAAPAVEVEAVELPFSVDLYDLDGVILEERLVGAIDLVVKEAGRRVVVEHKTSAKRYGNDQLKFEQQPTAYRIAASNLGLGDVGLRFQIITKTKIPAVQVEDVCRGDTDVDDFLRTVVGVLRAVDVGAFYPVRGWQCRSCAVAYACADADKTVTQ
jgi:putative RecB family exonuclease